MKLLLKGICVYDKIIIGIITSITKQLLRVYRLITILRNLCFTNLYTKAGNF